MNDEELIQEIEAQRAMMIAVATGGPRIDTVNAEYFARRRRIHAELDARGIVYPNPYADLWAWYGKWSSGDLPSYQSRREYIAGVHQPLLDRILTARGPAAGRVFEEPTGWFRVDRDLQEMRRLLEQAQTEPQFQAVGLFSREILITLAQMVFEPDRHRAPDGVAPSATDAKRMLEAFVVTELQGEPNEATRRHARAALDVANDLQHRRTANFRSAALCAESTSSVVNLVAIISGRRDPR